MDGLEKLKKENLEAKISVLGNIEKKFKDLGPVYDCVVFHDGTMWRYALSLSPKLQFFCFGPTSPSLPTFTE